jgi:hypothetical protein
MELMVGNAPFPRLPPLVFIGNNTYVGQRFLPDLRSRDFLSAEFGSQS